MINETVNFNDIKTQTATNDWQFAWLNCIIPLIEKECLFPIPEAEVEHVNFINNTNVEIELKSDNTAYKNRFNNPYFRYKFCVRFLSMTRSKNPEYYLEYYWTGGPQDYGRMFWIDLHKIDYFTNNEHYKIKIEKITNLYELHTTSSVRAEYKITPLFSKNLLDIIGKATLFYDTNTLLLTYADQHTAFSILYDMFERLYTSDSRLFWFDNEFYVAGCWVKRGENHEKTTNRIHESVDFNNIQTGDLRDTFVPLYYKKIICEEFPKFLGEDTTVELNEEKTKDNKVVFNEIGGYNRIFFITWDDHICGDGKIHIRLYIRDQSNSFYSKFYIDEYVIKYVTDENSKLAFENIICINPCFKIYNMVIDEALEQNEDLRNFVKIISDSSYTVMHIQFDSLLTGVKFVYYYTSILEYDFVIDNQLSTLGIEGYNIESPEHDLLNHPDIIRKTRVKNGSKYEYSIWIDKRYVDGVLKNKYKNMIIKEMVNDTPYYIGNTEQMNNALAQANKDEALYAKNNFARHEFIRKVLGNKLYNDILDLGATGTFAPIPLNLIRLTHDDFRKLLKTNGLLDSDDVIIKIYNIIRQAYVRYLFREVNEKIDTDIVFKTFDEVIDFFYVLYHALEKVFLKRVIAEIDLKWKPITNKFKEYLV